MKILLLGFFLLLNFGNTQSLKARIQRLSLLELSSISAVSSLSSKEVLPEYSPRGEFFNITLNVKAFSVSQSNKIPRPSSSFKIFSPFSPGNHFVSGVQKLNTNPFQENLVSLIDDEITRRKTHYNFLGFKKVDQKRNQLFEIKIPFHETLLIKSYFTNPKFHLELPNFLKNGLFQFRKDHELSEEEIYEFMAIKESAKVLIGHSPYKYMPGKQLNQRRRHIKEDEPFSAFCQEHASTLFLFMNFLSNNKLLRYFTLVSLIRKENEQGENHGAVLIQNKRTKMKFVVDSWTSSFSNSPHVFTLSSWLRGDYQKNLFEYDCLSHLTKFEIFK